MKKILMLMALALMLAAVPALAQDTAPGDPAPVPTGEPTPEGPLPDPPTDPVPF